MHYQVKYAILIIEKGVAEKLENQKNNNGLIALLVVVIVILLTLVILFATGTINFKSDNNQESNGNSQINTNDNNSTDTIQTNEKDNKSDIVTEEPLNDKKTSDSSSLVF